MTNRKMRGVVLLGVWAGLAASAVADPITVHIHTDGAMSEQALTEHVRSALRGARAEILEIDAASGVILLEGDTAAARALRADPDIASINGPHSEPVNDRNLRVTVDQGSVLVEPIAPSLAMIAPVNDRTGWRGEMLRVEIIDATGSVISERFVPDPRFVRFEGWSDTGDHEAGSNRAEIRTDMPIQIQLAVPEASASLAVFDQAGSYQSPSEGRLLGSVQLDLTEAGQ